MITGTSGRNSLTLGSISRPVIPGMLISERISIRDCSIVWRCAPARPPLKLQNPSRNVERAGPAEIAGGTAPRRRARHRPQEPKRSRLTSLLVLQITRPRQNDGEFRELPGLRLDIDCATMLFHDDVVAH